MRKRAMRVLMLMLAVVYGLGGQAASAESLFFEKLPFKSAVITYTISGMEKGTETVYIDDYGRRSAAYRDTVNTMMGMNVPDKSLEIEDGEWVYSYDLLEGVGSKSRNPKLYFEEEFQRLSPAEQEQVRKNRKLAGMNITSGMGGEVEENGAELLGYSCDVVRAMGTTVYSIHNTSLTLKTEADVMGIKMSSVATAIDKGKVDEQKFALPAGIEAVHDDEADAMSLEMARQTMAWLKDPNAASKPFPVGEMMMGGMEELPEGEREEAQQGMEAMMKAMEEMMQKGAGN